MCCCILSIPFHHKGGIKAILWVDTLQMFVMIAGMLALIIGATQHVGGLHKVIQANQDGGRFNMNRSEAFSLRLH